MKKVKELRELSTPELEAKLVELQHEKFNVQFEIDSTKNSKNAHLIRLIRKTIARVKTLLRERVEELNNQLS